jgi:hypothetical protein
LLSRKDLSRIAAFPAPHTGNGSKDSTKVVFRTLIRALNDVLLN